MTSRLFTDDFVGRIGSLDTGTSVARMPIDRLPYKRNVEHHTTGAVTKRPGRKILARVAPAPEAAIPPVLANLGPASTTLTTGTLYVRITYSTVAGETDDLHSESASVSVTAGDEVEVQIPYHIMGRVVERHDTQTGIIYLADYFNRTYLNGLPFDTFNGWGLFCRDPHVQDSTGLGVNPDNRKMWDRKDPLTLIGDYSNSDYSFTLATAIDSDLTGKQVDILMPDRGGLPIRAANVYVSQDGVTYYIFSSVSPTEPSKVTVTSIPTGNRKAPSTRITRTAPTLAAASATSTNPVTGITEVVDSGLFGGEYLARYSFETASSALLDNGQWPELSSFNLRARPRRSTQHAWPSLASTVAIKDDEAITVTIPALPSGCERARVYLKRNTPYVTKTFVTVTNPSSTHRAYTYNPIGVGSTAAHALTPANFRIDADVAQFSTGPGQQSYSNVTTINGTTSTVEAAQDVYKEQYEFLLDAADITNTTSACLVVRMSGETGTNYLPATNPLVSLRRWNHGGSAWVDLVDDFSPKDASRVTLRLGHAFTSSLCESSRLVYDIIGAVGAGWEIDYIGLELYRTPLTPDPTPTSSEILAEITYSTSVTIDSPIVPAADGDAVIPNTTGQWPVAQHAAYTPNKSAASALGIAQMVGCADSVFVVEAGAMKRVYQHERNNGITDTNTLDVCEFDWQFDSVGARVFFCNEANDLAHNLRYDGSQTYGQGIAAPSGTVTLPESAGDDAPTPDPTPAADGCARFKFVEAWRPDPQTGAPTGSPGTVDAGRAVNPFEAVRWTVTDTAGTDHFFFDFRYISFADTMSKYYASMRGLSGRIWESKDVFGAYRRTIWAVVEVRTDFTDEMIGCLSRGAATAPVAGSGAGTATATDAVTSKVPPGKKDYYYLERRSGAAGTEGYDVRSESIKLATVTVEPKPAITVTNADGSVTVTEAAGTKVILHGPGPVDPQTTHVEFYRSLQFAPESAKMVASVPVTAAALDGNGNISVEDDKSDAELGEDLIWDAGRPPAATRIAWVGDRMWFVPKFNQLAVGYTILKSVSGIRDPEAWTPYNIDVPEMPTQSPITALAPYQGRCVIHTDNGMAISKGSSEDILSADAIGYDILATDQGAAGAKCWFNLDNAHFFMTRSSICALSGMSVEPISERVRGSLQEANTKASSASQFSAVHYRGPGKQQAWFTYSDRQDGRPDKALILALNIGGANDGESALWSQWAEMYTSSLCRTERDDGTEIVLIGDFWGRIHEHGALAHDNGVHVDAEIRTKPLELSGPAIVSAPRFLFLIVAGRAGDYLSFDCLKDMTGSRGNDRIQRVDMLGTGEGYWGDGGKWGANNTPGVWASESRSVRYREHRAGLGQLWRQFQLVLSQKWSDMPPGARRGQSFDITGYRIAARAAGYRKS